MMENSEIKILILDDDLLCLESLSNFLASEGYSVETSSDIDAAWDAIDRVSFDVVATDYMLKESNGLELIKHTKQVKPDTFTILFTGYSSPELLLKLKTHPVDLFLAKPLVLKKILCLLDTLVRDKRTKEIQEINKRRI